MALAGGIWHFEATPALAEAQAEKRIARPGVVSRPNPYFAVRGIKLGMTAETVHRLVPDMATKIRGSEHTGEFVADGVVHSIRFAPGSKPGPVYRIKYREFHTRLTTTEIIARFGEQFGQPVIVDCWQGFRVSRQGPCHFQWLTREGVKLDVRSQAARRTPSGHPRTILNVTATDTAAAHKLTTLRLAQGA